MEDNYKLNTLVFVSVLATILCQPVCANEADKITTATPIKHLVVLIQENSSFDHFFGVYPHAANLPGETPFQALPNTPEVNGLSPNELNGNRDLIKDNPNSVKPFRLTPDEFYTCTQNHQFDNEEKAFDGGKMDKFVEFTGQSDTVNHPYIGVGVAPQTTGCDHGHGTGIVMGYYDGNTITALWNYAQHFALNDNSYQTTFGVSLAGYFSLVAGDIHMGTFYHKDAPTVFDLPLFDSLFFILGYEYVLGGSLISNFPAPYEYDQWQPNNLTNTQDSLSLLETYSEVVVQGKTYSGTETLYNRNVGMLLNKRDISWGYFVGGFNPNIVNPDGSTGKVRAHSIDTGLQTVPRVDGIVDYSFAPFEYFIDNANPTHARPSSLKMIGKQDAANHIYDSDDFISAVQSGNMPAVSFIKAPSYQDGHPGMSSVLEQQKFIVNMVNLIQSSAEWSSTAIVILWDDSDGLYDHQPGPIVRGSKLDFNLFGLPVADGTICSQPKDKPVLGFGSGNCGYGTRLPLIVISPYAKANYVDHTLTDQTSVLRFIEDNWLNGERIRPATDDDTGSFDTIAGTIENMFDFQNPARKDKVLLEPNTGLLRA